LPVPVKAMAEAKREQRVNRKVFMVVEYILKVVGVYCYVFTSCEAGVG